LLLNVCEKMLMPISDMIKTNTIFFMTDTDTDFDECIFSLGRLLPYTEERNFCSIRRPIS